MSELEFADWLKYAKEVGGINPHRRIEKAIRESAALICTVIARGNGSKTAKIEDFMPKEPDIEDGDESQVFALLSRLSTGDNSHRIKWRRPHKSSRSI